MEQMKKLAIEKQMRVILFRGFSKRADGKDKIVIGCKTIYGEWVFSFPFRDRRGKWKIRWYDEKYESSKVSIVVPETVGQYTGFNDKNDDTIFEKDVLVGDNVVEYVAGIFSINGDIPLSNIIHSDLNLIAGNVYSEK